MKGSWMVWAVVAVGAVGLAVVLGAYMGPDMPDGSTPSARATATAAAPNAPASVPPERAGGRLAPQRDEPMNAPLSERMQRMSIRRVDAARIPGLDDASVQSALVAARADVKACHDAAAAHDPAVPRATTLVLELGPAADGLAQVRAVKSDIGGEFDACATRVLAQMKLPATDSSSLRLPMAF